MPDYRFVTNWRIAADIARVWDILRAPEAWPDWWYGLERVEVISPGDDHGVGAVRRFVFRGQLPYRLSFYLRQTRQEEPTLLEGQAWGELEGIGRWELRAVGSQTEVRYTWAVSPTAAWMKFLAPLARPAFVWNHDWVMRQGERGLKQLLEAPTPLIPDGFPRADPSRSARRG
ncbi:MAG: SRPBCC family protein [Chloroflexi bacterium]|nr:SRPBCC family protein [Chloroflexota bacterium]